MLEKGRKRLRLENRNIDYIEAKEDTSEVSAGFQALVPGLNAVVRRNRRLKSHQVDPNDEEAVKAVMNLNSDESVQWEEE